MESAAPKMQEAWEAHAPKMQRVQEAQPPKMRGVWGNIIESETAQLAWVCLEQIAEVRLSQMQSPT